MPKLSILIPTLPERLKYKERLHEELVRQRKELGAENEVQILFDPTPKGVLTVGAKRTRLVLAATGDSVMHHDDDDFPAPNYLKRTLEGVATGADIVTFNMNYFEKGKYVRKYIINRFLGEIWTEDVYTIDRNYFHLCAIKREIAKQVVFPNKNFQEDLDYSYAIKPLLKTEHRIDECLYNYYFDNDLSQTRDNI